MTSKHRTRTGLVAALAVASLAAAAPAGADPPPHNTGLAQEQLSAALAKQKRSAALAQEQYYMSHKPAIPAPGHDFATSDPRPTVVADAVNSSGFEWDDAAIGAASALGLVLVLAGGAAATSRRHRPATS
jgi:hypothetical protein